MVEQNQEIIDADDFTLVKVNIMRLNVSFLTLIISLGFVSCSIGTAEESNKLEKVTVEEIDEVVSEKTGEQLLNDRCMICHKLAPTHDELLAPPMRGIQMNYKSRFDSKAEFVEAVVNWASGPDSTKSVMPGALEEFGLMPYLSFSESELYLIANYIYDADLPRPAWAGKGGKHGKGHGNGP